MNSTSGYAAVLLDLHCVQSRKRADDKRPTVRNGGTYSDLFRSTVDCKLSGKVPERSLPKRQSRSGSRQSFRDGVGWSIVTSRLNLIEFG